MKQENDQTRKQTLNILIGDDLIGHPVTSQYITPYFTRIEEELTGYDVQITLQERPEKVIEEALTGKYDVVVTDLDYGMFGTKESGYDIVDAIAGMEKRPLVIMNTSCDNTGTIKERTVGKVDHYSGENHIDKFEGLVDVLVKHYR